jgi:hypothetical protein
MLSTATSSGVWVSVVLGDVEQRRHAGMERFNALQLEAGNLRDNHVALFAVQRRRAQRVADVPGHVRDAARVFKHFAQQGDGGGFSVRAGYGQQFPLREGISQFQLPNQRYGALPRGFDQRRIDGHARADNDQIAAVHDGGGVLPQPVFARRALQRHQRVGARFPGFFIVKYRPGAVAQQQLRRRDAAARHADHHHAFSFDSHARILPCVPWPRRDPEKLQQGKHCDHRQYTRYRRVHRHDLRFRHAAQLEMMVHGRHFEDGLAVRELEVDPL